MSDTPSDIETALEGNAQGAAESTNLGGERVKTHSLQDQIEADRYLERKRSARSGRLPIRLFKLRPPGAV